ncbi:homogentisate 1,2-dioxygenase [Paenibacillus sp. HJGM_3]|uniref:homogentisate 1,2-dioxygenase n=1 Tax=Paenibacillus sp. HJGM_3 TaxID=3379816 RepID=UPI003859CEEF
MPYMKQGTIPAKRHTAFYKPDGSLFREQVMGTKGFSGIQSILYHCHPPTAVLRSTLHGSYKPTYEQQGGLRHRHFRTSLLHPEGDPVTGRRYLLGNDDVRIGTVHPNGEMDYFYRNGEGDELLFVHYGSGIVETMFGTLEYRQGDYIVIPIGTIHRIVCQQPSKFLFIETTSWITTPKRYRNEHGQLLEHSPFCERDMRLPDLPEPRSEYGEFEVRTKAHGMLHSIVMDHHPLDVVGWDGHLYPWILNIGDFEPITGRIHMPPPIHQTFEGNNFVICSFVPRMYDYHPQSIPAPYFHSNVDSDEVLYYADGSFMSRKGIEAGSITLHPAGIPHGPHPGKIEQSIGKKDTRELAVMIDTFRPLHVVESIKSIEDEAYMGSWVEK